LPEPLARLVEQLQKLPGIGAKGAQRLAFHVLKNPREDAERLCDAIRDVKEQVTYCSTCNNITATDRVCSAATTRDHRIICVIEEPQNVMVVRRRASSRALPCADGRSRRSTESARTISKSRACSARGAGSRRGDSRDESTVEGKRRRCTRGCSSRWGSRPRIAIGIPVGSTI
jgi:hypothetical protein